MKVKLVWLLGGVLILGVTMLVVSCAGLIEPPPPPVPVATFAPPLVPHSIEGRADCLLCHEKGIGGAPQYPSSHIGRPSDVCLTCHAPATAENVVTVLPTTPTPPAPPLEPTPTAVSAGELYVARCAACHGANRQGVPGLAPPLTPESLAALSDSETRYIISDGRTGTAMPPFKGSLSPEEIDALLQLIKSIPP
ncbi:MAG: c-type cytochrome [Chloroflexi bacterium]|nr:c-type cytochrome [Chloroflexota bacterium]